MNSENHDRLGIALVRNAGKGWVLVNTFGEHLPPERFCQEAESGTCRPFSGGYKVTFGMFIHHNIDGDRIKKEYFALDRDGNIILDPALVSKIDETSGVVTVVGVMPRSEFLSRYEKGGYDVIYPKGCDTGEGCEATTDKVVDGLFAGGFADLWGKCVRNPVKCILGTALVVWAGFELLDGGSNSKSTPAAAPGGGGGGGAACDLGLPPGTVGSCN
ncbi:MAG: hypothetical protein OXU73_01035 [Candidatus Campbellbacteria bacterium]|nr:hypothetical protein [Candidatus Campbellbacteria bacterium]